MAVCTAKGITAHPIEGKVGKALARSLLPPISPIGTETPQAGEDMARHSPRRFLVAALVLGACFLAPLRAGADGILVFAAASLKTALDEVSTAYQRETGNDVTISYAASSVLARQLQQGAPADLFISANEDWMDVLQKDDVVKPETRVALLGNGLVLIGAAPQTHIGEVSAVYDLAEHLEGGFLAMALVDAVPAGIYGKAALQSLGLWDAVQRQVAQTDNVRAALALVATGAAPMGIVYRTDAQADARVGIVGSFPEDSHPPIIYPVAETSFSNPEAQNFLTFLQSEFASDVFKGQGFSLPER